MFSYEFPVYHSRAQTVSKFVLVVFEISVRDFENCLSVLYSDEGRFGIVFYTVLDLRQPGKLFENSVDHSKLWFTLLNIHLSDCHNCTEMQEPCKWISQFCVRVALVESLFTKIFES